MDKIDWEAISKRVIEIAKEQNKVTQRVGGADPLPIERTGDVETALLEY